MKYVPALICVLMLAICIFGAGFVWFITHIPTPELLAMNQELAETRAKIALMQAKEQYTHSYVQAQRDLKRLEQQQAIEAGLLYKASAALSRAVVNLWPLWLIASALTFLWQQRARWTPQVQFSFDGMSTTVPADRAVELTQKAMQAKELESSARILALQEDRTSQRFKDNLAAIRTLKGFVKDTPADVVDITPESLPAFSGDVYLSQLLLDDQYEAGLIPVGRSLDTGGLVQVDWPTRKTCIKLGEQGTGKSMSARAEIWAAFCGKYERSQQLRLHIIDAHYGFSGSLATDLKAYLPLFDTCVLGKAALSGNTLAFLQQMILEAEAFQASDRDDPDYLDLIWFDECNETIEESDDGKGIEKALKRLINLRKAGKYLSLNMYDGSKGDRSNKGLNPAKMAVSQMIYRTTEAQAGNLLGWAQKAIIQQVPNLKRGQCVLHLPDSEESVALCQTALVTEADFYRFARYLPPQDAPSVAEDADIDLADTQQDLTPEFVRAWIEECKATDLKYSQNKLAAEIGFSKKDMSLWMNGKLKDPKKSELETALVAMMFVPQDHGHEVVSLKQYREQRGNS